MEFLVASQRRHGDWPIQKPKPGFMRQEIGARTLSGGNMRFSNTIGIVSTGQKAAKFCLFLVAFVVTALLASSSIQAQQYLGTLSGSVADQTGAKVVGASVTAKAALTNFETKAITNGSGDYTIPFLTPDTYTVTIKATGFGGQTLTGIVLTASATARADFTLKAAGANTEITVNADTELLDTTSANLATTMLTEEVTDTPNIGRNPFVLSTLAAGVFSAGSGGYEQGKASTYTNPYSGVAVQIDSNGSAGHNRLTLDGVADDPSERFSGASYTGFVPSPEAVQEVKTQTGLYDAAYGHGDGVVANTVLKTGSNAYHGAAYWVFRNTYMDANPWQNNDKTPKANRPNDQWMQPGGVFDGPIRIPHVYNGRDKTFFTVAYEYIQLHSPTTYSGLMPTTSGGTTGKGNVGGDFGNLCTTFNANGLCTSGTQIFDPGTYGLSNPGQRNPYPFNVIAAGSNSTTTGLPTVTGINPAGAALMGYYPAPNTTRVGNTNYISIDTSTPQKYDSFVTRIDQQFSDKHHLDAKFFRAVLHQLYPNEGFPHAEGPGGTSYSYTVYRNNMGGSIEDSYVFNPTTVLNARFGTIYHPFGLVYPGAVFNLSSLNITGSALPYQSFPGTSFGDGYASLQNSSAGQVSEDALSSISVLLAKTARSHSLRVGFEGNLSRYNVQNPMSGVGTFAFDTTFTQETSSGKPCAAPYTCTSSGDDMAALLLGVPTSGTYANQIAYALSQQYEALFVQDDWRVSSKLTINAGLRWDYESPFTDRYNRMTSGFCTTCTNPLQSFVPSLPLYGGLTFANTTATPSRYIAPKEFGHLQPRLGAAYQITPKLVLHGGLGLFYFNTQDQPQAQGYNNSTAYVSGAGAFVPANSLSNPWPVSATLPDGVNLPTGNTLGLATQLGQSITYTEPTTVQPKQLQYTAGLQYQLPGQTVLQISYVGNKVFQLPVNKQLDVLPASYMGTVANPLTAAQITALQTKVASPFATLSQMSGSSLAAATIPQFWLYGIYPEFTGVTDNFQPIGTVLYNSLQLTVNKRLSHHFEIQGNFTWEKIMDKNVFLNPQDTNLFRYQDSQPNLIANAWGTYHFPEFTNKPLALREALGGWKLQGVLRAANGPLISNPGSTGGNANNPSAGNPGFTYQQLINPTPASRSYATEFNPCYQVWTEGTGSSIGTWANAPNCTSANSTPAFKQMPLFTLNTLGPYMNIRQLVYPLADASLFKTFKIRGSASFEIRGEFFNVLNTPNFGGPGTSPTASVISGTTIYPYAYVNQPGGQANDARLTQLTARFNF
jgi:hypothetical protein